MSKRYGAKEMYEAPCARGRTQLISYKTPVVVKDGSNFFVTNEYFSKTTSKHINLYLREYSRSPQAVHRVDQATLMKLVSGEI